MKISTGTRKKEKTTHFFTILFCCCRDPRPRMWGGKNPILDEHAGSATLIRYKRYKPMLELLQMNINREYWVIGRYRYPTFCIRSGMK